MSQIIFNEMSYHYVDFYNPVFDKITLCLDTNWKTGLIGRNGRGKTTLLKLLTGELVPSSGVISSPLRASYFPYGYSGTFRNTLDVVKEMIGGVRTLEVAMETALAENQSDNYFALLEQYQYMDGYCIESKIYKEAEHMQLAPRLLEQDFETLSGGEKTRMLILALFLRKDGYVLLDEPTNHLDQRGKEALVNYLNKQHGFLVVSHDSHFLNQVTDHILSINKTNLTLEHGNYATWKRNVLQKETFELRTKQRLEQEIRQLSRQSEENRQWSAIGNTQKYHFACNARANGARAYMRQAKRSEDKIAKNLEEKKGLLRNLEQAEELAILQERLGDEEYLLEAEGLSYSYVEEQPLLCNLTIRISEGERIWLRGRNGAGKSTLLRLLCGSLPCDLVHYAENLIIATAFQEPKWTCGNIFEIFRQESRPSASFPEPQPYRYERFLELCSLFDLPQDFTQRPLETLSSGELKKIDIARALSAKHQLLFLDEPLNYMDTLFREQLAKALCESNITTIFVEHDEDFGNAVATGILNLDYSSGRPNEKRRHTL